MHNLYFKHVFMDTFKILKKHIPISLYSLFLFNTFSKRQLLIPPKFSLDISKNNFVNKACSIWNSCIFKHFQQPQLDKDKNIVIPGSISNSDLSASTGYIKMTINKYLLSKQNADCPDEWNPSNFKI